MHAGHPATPAVRAATPPLSPARRGPDASAVVLGILCAIPAVATAFGLPYYLLSRAARLRSPLHPMLRPTGPVGLAFGIAGFAMFLFMWLYPLRKHARWLAWTGPVGRWLHVHVIAGIVIPLVVAVHAGWRFDGIIGLGYFSMLVVSFSGIVGRYLYTRIPRTRTGLEMTREQVSNERRGLVTEIAAATGLLPERIERLLATDARAETRTGLFATLRNLVTDDLDRRRALAALGSRLRHAAPGEIPVQPGTVPRVLKLARREIALRQQTRMLEGTRRVFGLWHVAHRPFAITALLAVCLHVAIAIAVGAFAP